MTTTTREPSGTRQSNRAHQPLFFHHEVPCEHPVGALDKDSRSSILKRLPSIPGWPESKPNKKGPRYLDGARRILEWLAKHDGEGWQDRWEAADGDTFIWIDNLAEGRSTWREGMVGGLRFLLLARAIRPSYAFFSRFMACSLFDQAQMVLDPALFARLDELGSELGLTLYQHHEAKKIIVKLTLHTGKSVRDLTDRDFFELRAAQVQLYGKTAHGVAAAWELLRGAGVLSVTGSLREVLRRGQRPTAELVDSYGLRCTPIRDLLVRYLNERRPGLDYGSFRQLVRKLAKTFWGDIERHHPGIDSLHLPAEVATAWKERLRVVTRPDGSTTPRKEYHSILISVQAFYSDVQAWALEDASWAPFASPSPIARGETDGMIKQKKATQAVMHQRIRDRLPHLPRLIDAAEHHRESMAVLLKKASEAPIGTEFEHEGVRFRRRSQYNPIIKRSSRMEGVSVVLAEELDTGTLVNLTHAEDEAFWAWAMVETLRHTGIRIEELLELTHLALVQYRLPDTGEVVPLLQIVPSKSNEERLLLISPELASVLATIITRLRAQNGGNIPTVSRYDPTEKIHGPPLPHLFQRRTQRSSGRSTPISQNGVYRLLQQVVDHAGITDNTGQPLNYLPHDFRRLFTTEAVTGGLPVHIAAKLLGHHHISTTESYLAVFQNELIRTYRAFLDKRRATWPVEEYREPTDAEWQEFHQHFHQRKLELGTCGRPYGSPCQHEHACVRCPMLRMDPKQRGRLVEIIHNLSERIQEAKLNGWLGEVQGLNTSLEAAKKKLVSLDRSTQRAQANGGNGPTLLGISTIGTSSN
ncbi:tyrosine-type recombinase/integrase [Saccharopolyspora sp. NPDC002376]